MGYRNAGSPPRGLHYGGPRGFKYRIVAVRSSGEIAVSDAGLVYAANGALSASNWKSLVFHPSLRRVLAVAGVGGAAPLNTLHIASTQDGDTWAEFFAPAPGKAAAEAVRLFYTPLWGGRLYCQVRDNGTNLGGIWFSTDGGLTWAEVAWPFAKVSPHDVEYMSLGPDRLVCMGHIAGGGAAANQIFFTTDGATMVAGPQIPFTFGLNQLNTGYANAAAFFNGQFVMGGLSASNFFPPVYVRTIDGTAFSGPDTIDGVALGAGSGGVTIMPAVPALIFGWPRSGVAPATAFARTSNGIPLSWVATPEAVGFTPLCRNMAFSPSLARAVFGCGIDGFGFTDDAVIYTPVAAPVANNWNAIVATR